MSRFETTFRTAIANAERDVLVDQIRANPQMSLNELGKLATGELGSLLKQITIGDLIAIASRPVAAAARGEAAGGRKAKGEGKKAAQAAPAAGKPAKPGKPAKAAEKAAEKAPAKAAQAEVDTRTAEGRAAYDQAVLAALQGTSGPQSASDITRVAGGSPLQIRTALARLIEAGSVHWSGRARGTRYTPA
jgi:hypothetical protein